MSELYKEPNPSWLRMTRSVLREAERTLRGERKAKWGVTISRYDRVRVHQGWEVKRRPRCLMKGQGSYLVQNLEMDHQADHDHDLLHAADQGSTECHACNRRSCPGTFPRNGPVSLLNSGSFASPAKEERALLIQSYHPTELSPREVPQRSS